MPLRYKIYTSFDDLPIYNWDILQRTNDLRYLLNIGDYTNLPRFYKYILPNLQATYISLIKSKKPDNESLLILRTNIVSEIKQLVIDISKNSKSSVKIELASTMLRAIMIDPTKEELLWKVEFTETPAQRHYLTAISIAIKRYKDKLKSIEDGKKQTLFDQKVAIETSLNVNIDVKKCSVTEYMAYIDLMNKQTKRLTNKNIN